MRQIFIRADQHPPATRRLARLRTGPTLRLAAALAAAVCLTATAAYPAGAAPRPKPPLAGMSASDDPANDPADRQLEPLRAAADALDQAGRGSQADVYAGLSMDAGNGQVNLYLTDPTRRDKFISVAETYGDFDASVVHVTGARHTKAALDAARDKLLPVSDDSSGTAAAPKAAADDIISVAVPPDGSGLTVGLSDSASSASALQDVAGVPVTTQNNVPQSQDTWGRYDNGAPYYSGAKIFNNSRGYSECSTGVTGHNSRGTTYIFTAAHCADLNDTILNGSKTYLGRVAGRSTRWDAALIDARSLQYEWDYHDSEEPRRFVTHGAGYTRDGDSVCQDGFVTQIICGLQVLYQDITLKHCGSHGCMTSRGVVVYGYSGTVVRNGDSGGLVFCYCGGRRQQRGMVSANYGGNSRYLFLTEAPDILRQFGLTVWS